MFVVFLKFTEKKPLAAAHMEAHQAWLQQGFDEGAFLAAGSLEGGQGGAILAAAQAREALEARIAADPFVEFGVVAADITGFSLARTDPKLAFLRQAA